MKTLKSVFGFLAIATIATTMMLNTSCNNEKTGGETKDTAKAAVTPATPRPNPQDSIANTLPKTKVEFENLKLDKGKIKEGDMAKYVFKFKNTGDEPLTITNARGSCGCTVPTWPKEPIKPGESGEIVAEFNSKGKPGMQTKTVTVTTNTDPINTTLTIMADVQADPNAPKPEAAQPNIQVQPGVAPAPAATPAPGVK